MIFDLPLTVLCIKIDTHPSYEKAFLHELQNLIQVEVIEIKQLNDDDSISSRLLNTNVHLEYFKENYVLTSLVNKFLQTKTKQNICLKL